MVILEFWLICFHWSSIVLAVPLWICADWISSLVVVFLPRLCYKLLKLSWWLNQFPHSSNLVQIQITAIFSNYIEFWFWFLLSICIAFLELHSNQLWPLLSTTGVPNCYTTVYCLKHSPEDLHLLNIFMQFLYFSDFFFFFWWNRMLHLLYNVNNQIFHYISTIRKRKSL